MATLGRRQGGAVSRAQLLAQGIDDPSFASDRRRSRRLGAIGWHAVRGTWIDLDERPAELAADRWAPLLARRVA